MTLWLLATGFGVLAILVSILLLKIIPFKNIYLKSFTIFITLSCVFMLYGMVGGWSSIQDENAYQDIVHTLRHLQNEESLNANTIQTALSELEQRLPKNPLLWQRMGDIYQQLGWYHKAALAYQQAILKNPKNTGLLLNYAYAQSLSNGGLLEEATLGIVKKILESEPRQPAALNLLATHAFQSKQYDEAIEVWGGILRENEVDDHERSMIETALNKAKEKRGGTPDEKASLHAQVRALIDAPESIKKSLTPDTSVFIFAKLSNQVGPPLAVVKKQVRDLPCFITLDQSNQMRQDVKLQYNQEIIVGARISKSNNPMPQAGDIQGLSKPLILTANLEVTLLMNEVI